MQNQNSKFYFTRHLAWQIEPVTQTVYVTNLKSNFSFFFFVVEKDLWQLIYRKVSIKNMVDLIEEKYGEVRSIIESDVKEFLLQLSKEELIYEIS